MMAARVCSDCTVNWPNVAASFNECPLCGEPTEYKYAKNADFSESDAAAYVHEQRSKLERARAAPSPAHANRVERYRAFGFSEVDAQILALALEVERDSSGRLWSRPLNWQRVKRALDAGCSREQAVQIFA